MTQLEKDYQVFNAGIDTPASITLRFVSPEDAAWIERAVVELKRDGQLSPLMAGILKSSLKNAGAPTVRVNNRILAPEEIKAVRLGAKGV
jgi:hypothetical protein